MIDVKLHSDDGTMLHGSLKVSLIMFGYILLNDYGGWAVLYSFYSKFVDVRLHAVELLWRWGSVVCVN